MNVTIDLPDESAAQLQKQASAHGVSLKELVQKLVCDTAQNAEELPDQRRGQTAVARILEIQSRVKPDPQGWTIRDYIDRGRH